MKTVGFVQVKYGATSCRGTAFPERYKGQICPVVEFFTDYSVLVKNEQHNELVTIESHDIYKLFRCRVQNDIIIPHNYSAAETIDYIERVKARPGGYNEKLKNIIINQSLWWGSFNDSILWVNTTKRRKKSYWHLISNI